MSLLFDIVFSIAVFMLVSLGLLIVLGLMNIINLAHTAFMAVAVYVELLLIQAGWGFWLAMVISICATAALGAVVELIVVRRLYGRHIDDTILATWGVSLVLVQLLALTFGRTTISITPPLSGSLSVMGELISVYRLFVVGALIVLVLALEALMRYRKVGLIIRMVMTNEELASAVGIDTGTVRRATFIAGAAFAGAAGALLGPTQGINPSFAMGLLAPTFLIVLMSGRQLKGLFYACVLVGTLQTLLSVFGNPVVAQIMVVCSAVFVLRLWPAGLVWQRH